jgi:hypothetical protein
MRLNIELNIKMVVGYGYMTREESWNETNTGTLLPWLVHKVI